MKHNRKNNHKDTKKYRQTHGRTLCQRPCGYCYDNLTYSDRKNREAMEIEFKEGLKEFGIKF